MLIEGQAQALLHGSVMGASMIPALLLTTMALGAMITYLHTGVELVKYGS